MAGVEKNISKSAENKQREFIAWLEAALPALSLNEVSRFTVNRASGRLDFL